MTKRLVVHDNTSNAFEAIDPQQATAIGVSTFRVLAQTPAAGQAVGEAIINTASRQAFVWNGAAWTEITPSAITIYDDDAKLLAVTPQLGDYAMAADSGNLYMSTAQNTWRLVGIRNYATQANLLADVTASEGDLGVALDVQRLFISIGGAWQRVNPQTTVAATAPTAGNIVGDIWFDTTTNTIRVYDGTGWTAQGGTPTGTIIMHTSITPPAGFLLCDGSPIPAGTQYDALRTMIGPNTPDLVDQFVRGAANQTQIDGFNQNNDTTRLPRGAPFHVSGNVSNGGNHTHGFYSHMYNTDGGWSSSNPEIWTNTIGSRWSHRTEGGGLHHHTFQADVTGGDPETAPVHVRVAYHIRF